MRRNTFHSSFKICRANLSIWQSYASYTLVSPSVRAYPSSERNSQQCLTARRLEDGKPFCSYDYIRNPISWHHLNSCLHHPPRIPFPAVVMGKFGLLDRFD